MTTTKKLEIFAFIIFCILTIFLTCFHEPWFDEMQAWAVSKNTIYNILFFAPHFEGHPPIWHLILKLFSSLNINAEVGIRIPNLLFMFLSIYILLFKSPFHKIYKILLIFTYFIFYQYTILSRPYSLFCFALFLSAVLYKNRNLAPFKYIFSLILLCLSSFYGMILASGLVIVWFIEIIKNYKINREKFTNIFKDNRFFAFIIFFIVNLILTIIIFPDKNVELPNSQISINYILKFLYALFGLTADATVYNFYDYFTDHIFYLDLTNVFKNYSYALLDNLISCFRNGIYIGAVINIILILYFIKIKKFLTFIIPYSMFIIFSGFIYISPHHIGLLFLFFIFVVWCAYEDNNVNSKDLIVKIFNITAFICICIQISWSSSAFYYELYNNYSIGREVADFIKTNNLQNCRIMANLYKSEPMWINQKTNRIVITKINGYKPEYSLISIKKSNEKMLPVIINQYFNKNLFYNFNIFYPNINYLLHKVYTPEQENFEEAWLKEQEMPDVIIGKIYVKDILGEKIDLKQYIFKQIENGYIFKNKYLSIDEEIYVKKDLLK